MLFVKRVPSDSRSAKYFSRTGKISTFGQGVIKRAFSIPRDINSYYFIVGGVTVKPFVPRIFNI